MELKQGISSLRHSIEPAWESWCPSYLQHQDIGSGVEDSHKHLPSNHLKLTTRSDKESPHITSSGPNHDHHEDSAPASMGAASWLGQLCTRGDWRHLEAMEVRILLSVHISRGYFPKETTVD